MKRIISLLIFSIFALTSCDDTVVFQWSPDGKHLPIIATDGLRISDANGNLEKSLPTKPKVCRWLSDSRHAVVVTESTTSDWKVVDSLLTPADRRAVIRAADKAWQTASFQDPKTDQESDRQKQAYIYLLRLQGAKRTEARFRHLLQANKFISPTTSIHAIKLVDLLTPNPKAERLLWQSLESISDVQISPNEALLAISTTKTPDYKISLLPMAGGQVKTVIPSSASYPQWSRDGQSLFYLAKSSSAAETSETGTLNSATVADLDGHILKNTGKPKVLVDVCLPDISKIKCLPDNTILFSAKRRIFPSISKTQQANCLYRLSRDQTHLDQIEINGLLSASNNIEIEPNQDGSKIALFDNSGEISVFEPATGQLTDVEKSSKQCLEFAPVWRTADELCFPSRVEKPTANGHSKEVILQSISNSEQRTALSKDWKSSEVEFLRDREQSQTKPTSTGNKRKLQRKKVRPARAKKERGAGQKVPID